MRATHWLFTGGLTALVATGGFLAYPMLSGLATQESLALLHAGGAGPDTPQDVDAGGNTDVGAELPDGPSFDADGGLWELAADFNGVYAEAFVGFTRFQNFLTGLAWLEARFGPRGSELGRSTIDDLVIVKEARDRLNVTLALSNSVQAGFFGKIGFAVLLSRIQRQLGYYGSGRLDEPSSALIADIGAAVSAGVPPATVLPSLGTPSANPVRSSAAWRQRPSLQGELFDGVRRPERADIDQALPWVTFGEESDRMRATAYDDADDRSGKPWNRIRGEQTIGFGVDLDQDFPQKNKVTADGAPWRRGLEGPFYIPDAQHAADGKPPAPGDLVRTIMTRAGVDVARWSDLRLGADRIDSDDAYALTVAEMLEKRATLTDGRGPSRTFQLKNFEQLPTHVRALLIELQYYRGDGFLRNNPRVKAALEQSPPDYRAAARAMLTATGIDHGTRRIVWFVAALEAAAKGEDPRNLRTPREFYARLENPALMDFRPVTGADDDWPITARAIKPYLAGLTRRDAERAAGTKRKPIDYFDLYRRSLDRFMARPQNAGHPEMRGVRARRAAVFDDAQGHVDPGLQCIPNSALGVVPETDVVRTPVEWMADGCQLHYVSEDGWRVPCSSASVTRYPYAGVELLVRLTGEPPISSTDGCRVTWKAGVRVAAGGGGTGTNEDSGSDPARRSTTLEDWLTFLEVNRGVAAGGASGDGSGADEAGDGWAIDTVGPGTSRSDLPAGVRIYQVNWVDADGGGGSAPCAIADAVRFGSWDNLLAYILQNCARPQRQT